MSSGYGPLAKPKFFFLNNKSLLRKKPPNTKDTEHVRGSCSTPLWSFPSLQMLYDSAPAKLTLDIILTLSSKSPLPTLPTINDSRWYNP